MIDCKEIFRELNARWHGGETQDEIAKATGVGRSYLCELFSGKRPIEGLSIKKLNQLFPKASLHLHGDPDVIADNSGTNNGVVGVNNGTVNGAAPSPTSVEDFRSKAINVLMDLEIPPDALVKVLKTLKDLHI